MDEGKASLRCMPRGVTLRQGAPVNADLAGIGWRCPGEASDECRFAGAVFTQQRVDLPSTDGEVTVRESYGTAEHLFDARGAQQGIARRRCLRISLCALSDQHHCAVAAIAYLWPQSSRYLPL